MCKNSLRNKALCAVLGLFLGFAAVPPAFAGWFDGSAQAAIKQALEQSPLTIDGFALNDAELKTFYAVRENKSAWDISDKERPALKASIASLTQFSHEQGIFLDETRLAFLNKLVDGNTEEDRLKLELVFSDFLLNLARQLHGDGLDPAAFYTGWPYSREMLDIPVGLAHAVEHNNVSEFIAGLAPKQKAYLDLLTVLKTYRAMAEKGSWPIISKGSALKPGNHDTRIGQMRARLSMEGYVPSVEVPQDNNNYDTSLEQDVKNFQQRNGLKADGHVGARTIAMMNIPLAERIDQIIANLERWRHMPENFPARYVAINIADQSLKYWENGEIKYRSAVIVGKPDRKTPFVQSEIRSVIFNPAWHVPTKIARKDILPKLRKDPHYLEKLGFVINGSADDPYGANIDWDTIKESAFNFRLRQSPGDMNSLGRLKFDFDNDFAVYMHGTPHQELFEKAERFFSSGCVRLEEPEKFAQIVLVHNAGDWTVENVRAEIDKNKTHWLKVTEPLPLYFNYWTVFLDENGMINFRDDAYGYDQLMVEAMRTTHVPESLPVNQQPQQPVEKKGF